MAWDNTAEYVILEAVGIALTIGFNRLEPMVEILEDEWSKIVVPQCPHQICRIDFDRIGDGRRGQVGRPQQEPADQVPARAVSRNVPPRRDTFRLESTGPHPVS